MNKKEIKEHYEEFGFVIVKNLIDFEKIQKYKKYFIENQDSEIWKSPPEVVEKIPLLKYRWEVFKDDKTIRKFLNNKKLLQVAKTVLEYRKPKLHLSIIPWSSYGQDWHTDGNDENEKLFNVELHPKASFTGRVGAWIALDKITLESGPFTYIPKSHKIDYKKDDLFLSLKEKYEKTLIENNFVVFENGVLKNQIKTEPPDAFAVDLLSVKYAEFINHIYVPELLKNGFKQEAFLPECGDVLFWGPRLIHKAVRSQEGVLRPSIIGHYYRPIKIKYPKIMV